MSRPPRTRLMVGLLAVALLAVLVGVSAWWSASQLDVQHESATKGTATADAPQLPNAITNPAPPDLPAPTESAPAAALPAGVEPAAGKPALTHAEFSGRVVDAMRRPVVGATVLHWPSFALRTEQKWGVPGFGEPVDRARLAQTRTDADGRFRVAIDDRPPPKDPSAPGAYAVPDQRTFDVLVPGLVVLHADFEATLFPCRGWTGGPYAAGELVVKPGASVAGRVVDEEQRPLAGVAVALPPFGMREDRTRDVEWDSICRLLGVVTGADGRFVLDSLWAGSASVSFTQPGRNGLVLWPVLLAGETVDLGDIVLESGAVIEGVVQDAQGRPIVGARVLARPDHGDMNIAEADAALFELTMKFNINGLVLDVETTSDAAGRFRLQGLATNRLGDAVMDEQQVFNVVADADGFEPALLRNVKPGAGPVTLALPPEGSVVLTVLQAGGEEPVPQLQVRAERIVGGMDSMRMPVKMPVVSDAAELEAAGLAPPFKAVYLLRRAGSLRNELRLSAPGFATQGFVLPAVAPGERKSLSLKLLRESQLSGRILDADGQPIADARVVLVAPETLRVSAEPRETRSDAAGRFAFDAMQRGDWAVRASAPGFVEGESARVTVKKESVVDDLELVLQRAGAIEGVVLKRGVPVAGVVVRANPPKPPEPAVAVAKPPGTVNSTKVDLAAAKRAAQTDEAGHFRIESLAPGLYELSGPPGVHEQVTVVSGETAELSIAARAPPRVHGLVSDAKGPVAGALVVSESRFPGFKGWIGANEVACDRYGRFEIVLADVGHYRLAAEEAGASTVPTELDANWDDELTIDLRFAAGVLRGVVVEQGTGEPVAGADLQLWDAGSALGGWRANAESGADGHFELARVPFGALKLHVRHDDFSAPGVQEVQLGADGTAELRLELRRAGRVSGIVHGEQGEGLMVRLVPLAGQDALKPVRVEEGRFERWQLAPGAWRFELFRREGKNDGPVLASVDAQVAAGNTVSVELTVP